MQLAAEQTSLEPLPHRVGPDGRRQFKSQSAHRRRQPIIERHHLGPTLKGLRPSSSQGGFKQVAEYFTLPRFTPGAHRWRGTE